MKIVLLIWNSLQLLTSLKVLDILVGNAAIPTNIVSNLQYAYKSDL